MIMTVMSVFDVASGVFARPVYVVSIGAGMRMFTDEVNRDAKDNVMYQHPGDFQLFDLARWDDQSGLYEMLPKPVRVSTGLEVKV